MITLGYIEKLNSAGSNLITVRLPILEKSGVGGKALFSANVAYDPGNLNGFVVGDCVAVGFLDNTMDCPIVLGRLYSGNEKSATNFANANSLNVSDNATLPGNTTIGGVKFSDIKTKLNSMSDTRQIAEASANREIRLSARYATIGNKSGYGLFVNVSGLTNDDVGSSIYLYRTTRGEQTKGYKHPADRAFACNGVMGLGYGTIERTYSGESGFNFPAAPDWMSQPCLQTEWKVTDEVVSDGGIVVDIMRDWVGLACYCQEYDDWCTLVGCSKYGVKSDRVGCMRIKFGLVSGAGTLKGMSNDTLLIGPKAVAPSETPASLVDTEVADDPHLVRRRLYIKIE